MWSPKNQVIVNKSPVKTVFFGGFLITIYFTTQSYDAFNAAKFMALLTMGGWIIGYLVKSKNQINYFDISTREYRVFGIILGGVILSLFFSALFAYNKTVAFLGESFRRNGFLTYFGLMIFFYASVKFVRIENIRYCFKFTSFTLIVVVSYAFVQYSGHDWVDWSAKQVFSTLGNTNFAGAVLSILALLLLGQIFTDKIRVELRVFFIILFILAMFSIIMTNARQAIFQIIFGVFAFAIYLAWKRKKIFGIFLLIPSVVLAILSILGTLNKGPFKEIIYKDSVSVRGFYWRAGLKMFEKSPFFGVGLDNYNYFFKEVREPAYPLRYGFGLTSSNAHNVFIQNFATGGILLGTFYIVLQLYILRRAIVLLKRYKGEYKIQVLSTVVAWLAYELQAIVSIDNIGISIWGYILGGSIVGMSLNYSQTNSVVAKKLNQNNRNTSMQIVISSICLAIASSIVVPQYIVDRNVWINRMSLGNAKNSTQNQFSSSANQVLYSKFALPDYKNVVLTNMFDVFDKNQVIQKIVVQHNSDPRNLDTLNLLVYCEEKMLNYNAAINYRLEVAHLDPWNAQNYLGLAQLYRAVGDPTNMEVAVNKILSFASKDPIADVAKKEFLNNNIK